MDYGIRKKVNYTFEEAIDRTKETLAKEGFGILSEINVKETLKKKLDVDIDKYVILGACKPKFAHKALQVEQELGLLLPCNIIIYEKNETVTISAINPEVAMGFVDNEDLKPIASCVREKLNKIINNI